MCLSVVCVCGMCLCGVCGVVWCARTVCVCSACVRCYQRRIDFDSAYLKDHCDRRRSTRDRDVSGLCELLGKWLRTQVGNPCINALALTDMQIDQDTDTDKETSKINAPT